MNWFYIVQQQNVPVIFNNGLSVNSVDVKVIINVIIKVDVNITIITTAINNITWWLHLKQNKNNIKLYQATGTNRWVRPPVPKSTMDKNEPRRNSAGFAR
jgi:hypothetical protein